MLVSHPKRFVFLKTFKTASTSIEMYFEPFCVEPGHPVTEQRALAVSPFGIATARLMPRGNHAWWNHMPASEVRTLLGRDLFDEYFRFCTIRNPYDQLVSAFYFYERQQDLLAHAEKEQIELFRDWAAANTHRLPMHHFVLDGTLCVDAVIRYEQLSEDLEYVCQRTNVPFDQSKLSITKADYRTRSIPLAAYFDQKTEAAIEHWLQPHFELFGYEPL